MRVLLFFIPLLCCVPVFANGGGYFRGGVESSGDVGAFEPEGTENIRILDEKLVIELGPEKAEVEVRYIMRNLTEKTVKVRFGFPVEESLDNNHMEGEWVDRSKSADGSAGLKYCSDYLVKAGGEALPFKWQGEVKPASDERFKMLSGWLVSELKFKPGEEKVVRITYGSGYSQEVWSVSEDGFKGASMFRYRLSTGAVWGGTIGAGEVTVKTSGVPGEGPRVIKPVGRFAKEGEDWVWRFKDLEPTMADDIEIEVVPEERSFYRSFNPGAYPGEDEPWALYSEVSGKWKMEHAAYDVKASSTLGSSGEISYDAENLNTDWREKAWSEGAEGHGVGEWLEFVPKVAKPVDALIIMPGYQKTDELFAANSRPKRLKIELNGEHVFHADLTDSRSRQSIPIKGYTNPVKKFRITFEEVYPGSKYEDLCVTYVGLEAKLDEKPEIQPAR